MVGFGFSGMVEKQFTIIGMYVCWKLIQQHLQTWKLLLGLRPSKGAANPHWLQLLDALTASSAPTSRLPGQAHLKKPLARAGMSTASCLGLRMAPQTRRSQVINYTSGADFLDENLCSLRQSRGSCNTSYLQQIWSGLQHSKSPQLLSKSKCAARYKRINVTS